MLSKKMFTKMEEKNNSQLREMCKEAKITGMSKANRAKLIDSLTQYAENRWPSSSDEPAKKTKISKEESKEESNLKNPMFVLHNIANNMEDVMIAVSCGASSGKYPVVGKTVGFVKSILTEVLNINIASIAVVNGKNVEDTYLLKSDDVVEFLKKAGTKG